MHRAAVQSVCEVQDRGLMHRLGAARAGVLDDQDPEPERQGIADGCGDTSLCPDAGHHQPHDAPGSQIVRQRLRAERCRCSSCRSTNSAVVDGSMDKGRFKSRPDSSVQLRRRIGSDVPDLRERSGSPRSHEGPPRISASAEDVASPRVASTQVISRSLRNHVRWRRAKATVRAASCSMAASSECVPSDTAQASR